MLITILKNVYFVFILQCLNIAPIFHCTRGYTNTRQIISKVHWAATWCRSSHQGEGGGGGSATLCKTSSAPLDTIPATLQCTRDTHRALQWQIDAVTERTPARERDVAIENEVCVVAAAAATEISLSAQSQRDISLSLTRWTVSQSSRLYTYNNNFPRRCYKLQASSHLPPSRLSSFASCTQPSRQGVTFRWKRSMKYAWKFVVVPQSVVRIIHDPKRARRK